MKRYNMRFMARRIGAIGVWCSWDRTIEAESPEDARMKLYEEFEHIHVMWCKELT